MIPARSWLRRDFLKTSAGALFLAALDARLARGEGDPDRVLVLLELAGGNDGLNTVVPIGDDRYARLRGALALDPQQVLGLDAEVALHPSLRGMASLWEAGRLAIVEGVGYPQPNRSHFLSMDVWQSAKLDGRRSGTGWIGRYADAAFAGDPDPNRVVALGRKVPFSCEGETFHPVAVASPAAYRVIAGDRLVETLDSAVSSTQVSEHARRFLADAYVKARASSDKVRAAAANYRPAVEYPRQRLADDLKTVASLIHGGLATRVFAVQMGGFDTHAAQLARQDRLFTELGDALKAFLDDLDAQGLGERVLVVAYSEFGRRVKPNASGGTDHGTANPMFAAGAGVKGGLYGRRCSLEDLDDGDLRFTTDFRRAYATVIEKWLGADSTAILGERFEKLGFLG